MGRIICELERIYGVRRGGDHKSNSTMSSLKSQDNIMKELGMSKDTYLNYKKLTTLIPELNMNNVQLANSNRYRTIH